MSTVPVIIARAQPGADKSNARVTELGYEAIVSPALTLQSNPDTELLPPEKISGLVFTSANGARFYAEREDDRSLPAWCVGPATGAAARKEGFTEVHESTGNAVRLAAMIASTIAPPEKPLLHIANAAAKGDFQREMKMRRYKVKFAPLYQAGTAPSLNPGAEKLLDGKTPSIVLVHSAKGAEAFAQLTKDLSVSAATLISISTIAARPLEDLGYKGIHIAAAPNENALMETLQATMATL